MVQNYLKSKMQTNINKYINYYFYNLRNTSPKRSKLFKANESKAFYQINPESTA